MDYITDYETPRVICNELIIVSPFWYQSFGNSGLKSKIEKMNNRVTEPR